MALLEGIVIIIVVVAMVFGYIYMLAVIMDWLFFG